MYRRDVARHPAWIMVAVALAFFLGLVLTGSRALGASAVWALPSEAWADKGPAADGDTLTHLSYCGALDNTQGDPGNTVHFSVYVEDGGAWPLVYTSGEYGPQVSGCIELSISVPLGSGGLIEAAQEAGVATFGLDPDGTLTLTYGAAATVSPVVDMVAAIAGVYTSNLFGILGAAIALLAIVVIPALVVRGGARLALRGLRRLLGGAT